MMETYRRKPDLVKAIQITKSNAEEVAQFVGGVVVEEEDPISGAKFAGINLPTMDGIVRASEEDFVVQNSRGQVSVEKAGKFLYEYEEY